MIQHRIEKQSTLGPYDLIGNKTKKKTKKKKKKTKKSTL